MPFIAVRSSAYGPLRKHPEELREFAIALIFGDLFGIVDHRARCRNRFQDDASRDTH
jgi:hypothetical protein